LGFMRLKRVKGQKVSRGNLSFLIKKQAIAEYSNHLVLPDAASAAKQKISHFLHRLAGLATGKETFPSQISFASLKLN
jgi:hypothetical protein